MRQIDICEYGCPYCNGNLIVQGVDFSYEAVSGESTKTTYRCAGCYEEFYSVEEAHVAEPERAPEYKCPYCGQSCKYLSLKDDWTDYWKCAPCKVSFSESYNPNTKGIEIVNMYTTINDKLYVLRQFMKDGTSRVDLLPEDEEDTIVIAYQFNFLFPNINPSNIQNKLLTYLVFS